MSLCIIYSWVKYHFWASGCVLDPWRLHRLCSEFEKLKDVGPRQMLGSIYRRWEHISTPSPDIMPSTNHKKSIVAMYVFTHLARFNVMKNSLMSWKTSVVRDLVVYELQYTVSIHVLNGTKHASILGFVTIYVPGAQCVCRYTNSDSCCDRSTTFWRNHCYLTGLL